MPLKLSEAMRLGAMNRPQGRERMFYQGRTCAIGAALDAIGMYDTGRMVDYDTAADEWPVLHVIAKHPISGVQDDLGHLVIYLNDADHWTREAIADFVEQLERLQEPTSQPASRDWIGSVKS